MITALGKRVPTCLGHHLRHHLPSSWAWKAPPDWAQSSVNLLGQRWLSTASSSVPEQSAELKSSTKRKSDKRRHKDQRQDVKRRSPRRLPQQVEDKIFEDFLAATPLCPLCGHFHDNLSACYGSGHGKRGSARKVGEDEAEDSDVPEDIEVEAEKISDLLRELVLIGHPELASQTGKKKKKKKKKPKGSEVEIGQSSAIKKKRRPKKKTSSLAEDQKQEGTTEDMERKGKKEGKARKGKKMQKVGDRAGSDGQDGQATSSEEAIV